jgi:hypothetical protein
MPGVQNLGTKFRKSSEIRASPHFARSADTRETKKPAGTRGAFPGGLSA